MVEMQAAAVPEAGSLVRELGRTYAGLVAFYQQRLGLDAAVADARARAPLHAARAAQLRTCPPESVSWPDLNGLATESLEGAAALWESLKHEAHEELQNGHRAARALEVGGSPWERAQFLALRDRFREEWQPRGGIEDALLDSMAQSFTGYLFWLQRLQLAATTRAELEDSVVETLGRRPLASVDEAAWLEQCSGMVDRFHRLVLRTVRALKDLRRGSPIVVQAAQVNVGERQVNVAPATGQSTCSPLPHAPAERG